MRFPWSKKPKVVEPYVYIAGNPPLPLNSDIEMPNLASTSSTTPPPTNGLDTTASLKAAPSLGVNPIVAQPSSILDQATVPISFGTAPSAAGSSAVNEQTATLADSVSKSNDLDQTMKTVVNSSEGGGGTNLWGDSSSNDQAIATQPVAAEDDQTQNPLNHLGGPSAN